MASDTLPPDAFAFSASSCSFLRPYLRNKSSNPQRPFLTLAYASSLDSAISLTPGIHTYLSSPQSEAMTHYLRSQHDAVVVGAGTAIADDPGLNSRVRGMGGYGGAGLEGQPRPVVLDPKGRWEWDSNARVLRMVRERKGRGPLIFWGEWGEGGDWRSKEKQRRDEERERLLKNHGGKIIRLPLVDGKMRWVDILDHLKAEGIKSVMVEGGGTVINSLLAAEHAHLINSLIVTIAPTLLGQGGVVVCPKRRTDDQGNPIPVTRLRDAKWQPMGEDVVLCGKLGE
ncbi:hypothetical protein FGG08_002811 [Glutinoglossum americanum]|uniref:2,5-diamino-6-ribosylamino-4(3H)-pyrimidinone 5'-phosphate reductase n=1 Tax=Glutinoglossum americanum TaxID=1670608 RepID=A0A9P8L1B3_9PEZI|nr:hypothetical protein FGG08_002811 [Glutinoglossum americanum]